MAESVLGANVEKNDADISPMAGNIDPNGVIVGKKGQMFVQVIDANTAEIWINTDNGTTWV